ncbi:MAG: hypothetical protein U0736_11760 [Gemmataceae bacterium]
MARPAGLPPRGQEVGGKTPTFWATGLDGPRTWDVGLQVRTNADDAVGAPVLGQITVTNAPPTANAGGPYTVAEGSTVR